MVIQAIEFRLAKKLRELGCKQFPDEQFEYAYDENGKLYHRLERHHFGGLMPSCHAISYTLCEILEMLPKHVKASSEKYKDIIKYSLCLNSYGTISDFCIGYYESLIDFITVNIVDCQVYFTHKNPAQAAGLLLKWCVENGHVKIGEDAA